MIAPSAGKTKTPGSPIVLFGCGEVLRILAVTLGGVGMGKLMPTILL